MEETCPQLFSQQGAQAALNPGFPMLLTNRQGGGWSGLQERHKGSGER